jgi:hypothetical protein
MRCSVTARLPALLPALGLAFASSAHPRLDGRSGGEVLVMEMVSVTGTLRLAAPPTAGRSALEVDSGAMGRYRIDARGLGAELVRHVGEAVTVVAFVEASAAEGREILRVERFTVHEGEG